MALTLVTLVPLANIEASEIPAFRWKAVNGDPQFGLPGAAGLAGRWVVLQARLRFEHRIAWPFVVYQDHGDGYSEQTAFSLQPDAEGDIRFVWRASPALQAIRVDPLGQPGHFTISHFSLIDRKSVV